MPADNIISRTDAAALIPEDAANEIIKGVPEQSAALSLFRQVRMSRAQRRLPVIAALPTAYFVSGDTGMRQTTEVNWTNKYLNAEELACIVPIPKKVLRDTAFDIWAETQPLLSEAIGRALDAAVFFEAGKPSLWPAGIVSSATTAGNTVTRGTATQAKGGVAEDINQVMASVETDGYDVNGFVADRTYRAKLRGARDTTGQKLLDVTNSTIEGSPLKYAMRGLWPTGSGAAEFIAGDFQQGIVGVRNDLEWELWDQAVIQDPVTGDIVYNLAQQGMVAMCVTARFAFQVPNPINRAQATESARYPFGVLLQP